MKFHLPAHLGVFGGGDWGGGGGVNGRFPCLSTALVWFGTVALYLGVSDCLRVADSVLTWRCSVLTWPDCTALVWVGTSQPCLGTDLLWPGAAWLGTALLLPHTCLLWACTGVVLPSTDLVLLYSGLVCVLSWSDPVLTCCDPTPHRPGVTWIMYRPGVTRFGPGLTVYCHGVSQYWPAVTSVICSDWNLWCCGMTELSYCDSVLACCDFVLACCDPVLACCNSVLACCDSVLACCNSVLACCNSVLACCD